METKFRGQRVHKQGFIYGMPTYDFKYIFNKDSLNSPDDYEVIPETVGQFINIHDKNKVDIYSDDLLSDGEKTFRIYSVEGGFAIKAYPWCNNTNELDLTDELILMPCAQTRSWIENSCEVIGNIHTTPELLTVKNK